MGLARIFGVCAALLFASSVNAAVTIDLGPSDYRNWGAGSFQHRTGGIGSSFGQGVSLPQSRGTLTVTRNPVIPYGSVVNGMKNFVRITPGGAAASAAVTAAFLAMDWFFDQNLGQWVKDEQQMIDDPDFGLWRADGPKCSTVKGPSPESVCRASLNCVYDPSSGVKFKQANIINNTNAMCVLELPNGILTNSHGLKRIADCPEGSEYNPISGLCLGAVTGLPLTASDWASLEGEIVTMPPAIVGGAANDIMKRNGKIPGYHDSSITGPSSFTGPDITSTSVDPVTGDTIVTTTSTTTNISYGDTTVTTTNTTTSTTYQNGQLTSTTVTTETPGELPVSPGGASGDWPAFCEWASVVCDWLEWTQEEPPPEEDLPLPTDEDFYKEKTISFGSKACPPDYQINLQFLKTTVAVPFQPLCDFAGIIYYMVMAASYIIAAYISVGVARNG